MFGSTEWKLQKNKKTKKKREELNKFGFLTNNR